MKWLDSTRKVTKGIYRWRHFLSSGMPYKLVNKQHITPIHEITSVATMASPVYTLCGVRITNRNRNNFTLVDITGRAKCEECSSLLIEYINNGEAKILDNEEMVINGDTDKKVI